MQILVLCGQRAVSPIQIAIGVTRALCRMRCVGTGMSRQFHAMSRISFDAAVGSAYKVEATMTSDSRPCWCHEG